mgnify:FL=1
MRNLLLPRTENLGVMTIGTRRCWVQKYYPNGGTQCMVYVFYKGNLQQRGKVFKDESDFRTWATNAPMQHELFA